MRAGVAAGMSVDAFAPRLSFFWCAGMNYFMEVAKQRAARLLWAKLMRDNFDPKDQRSLSLRAHTQTSGWSLAAQDVFNNVARTTVEAMAATAGQTQSLHTNSLDEALALPTDFSARIARNTQLILQLESDLTRTIDIWGGSYFVERLTHDLAAQALAHIEEVEAAGGMTKAIEAGIPKRRIEAAAARTQGRIDSGEQTVVGVNKYPPVQADELPLLAVDNAAVLASQMAKLQKLRAERDAGAVERALAGPGERRARQRQPAGAVGRRRARSRHRRRDQPGAGARLRPPPRRAQGGARASMPRRRAAAPRSPAPAR